MTLRKVLWLFNSPARLVASMIASFFTGASIIINAPSSEASLLVIMLGVTGILLLLYSAVVFFFLFTKFLVSTYREIRYGTGVVSKGSAGEEDETASGLEYIDPLYRARRATHADLVGVMCYSDDET